MEKYKVWLLRCGSMRFWTGRKWDLRPYNAQCYATKERAAEAKEKADKKADEPVTIVEACLEVPK